MHEEVVAAQLPRSSNCWSRAGRGHGRGIHGCLGLRNDDAVCCSCCSVLFLILFFVLSEIDARNVP